MSEPKFTKGPIVIRESRAGFVLDSTEVFALAEIYGHDENAIANAKLYASSPELYKALEYVQEMMKYAHKQFNWSSSALDAKAIQMLNDAPVIVHNALAKADGKV
jgi:hypothetical protein